MPQPSVVDSGAADPLTPRTWIPNHKTLESDGSKRGVFHTTVEGTTVQNEGEKTLLMSTSDGTQLRKMTFRVTNVNGALGSVTKMVRHGNRVVFDTSWSYIEKKMTRDLFWLRERNGVFVVDIMVAPSGREQNSKSTFGRRSM